jgi:hypothetical protein
VTMRRSSRTSGISPMIQAQDVRYWRGALTACFLSGVPNRTSYELRLPAELGGWIQE